MSQIKEYLDGLLKIQQEASSILDKEIGLKVMHQYLTTEECCKFVNAMNTALIVKRDNPESTAELEIIDKLKILIEVRKSRDTLGFVN